MAVALPFIALAVEAGATAYGVHNSMEQSREAKDQMRDQENQQIAMQQEFQQQQAQQDQQNTSMEQAAINRQRAIASGYQNAAGRTNFTSPLGLPGGANTSRPSLLGL
jgi:hypothetical protein